MDENRLACFDALVSTTVRLRQHVETVAGQFGLTAPQARVVVLLHEPQRMQAIAAGAGCEPSHVTGLAEQLEAAGVAQREPDPEDRRARRLTLTPEGMEIRERLVPALLDSAPVISELEDGEVDTLLRLLERHGA